MAPDNLPQHHAGGCCPTCFGGGHAEHSTMDCGICPDRQVLAASVEAALAILMTHGPVELGYYEGAVGGG